MKKTRSHARKSPLAKRRSSTTKKSTSRRGTKLASLKAFSKHLVQDYALPLKRIVQSKIMKLQHRWA